MGRTRLGHISTMAGPLFKSELAIITSIRIYSWIETRVNVFIACAQRTLRLLLKHTVDDLGEYLKRLCALQASGIHEVIALDFADEETRCSAHADLFAVG